MIESSLHISYHAQRSSTARIRDGKIHLRISSLVSRREQERHIDELTRRMLPQLEKDRIQKIPLTLQPLLRQLGGGSTRGFGTGSERGVELLLSTGVEYHLRMKRAQGTKCKVQKVGNQLMVLVPVSWRELDLEQAEQALWKFLAKDQIPALKTRLDALRRGWMDEDFSTLKLKQVLSRWGSCDQREQVIMLSVKLLLVEPKLLDYVCVHELAHLRHADHSDLFWDLVQQKMPDWKVQRKRLRGYE